MGIIEAKWKQINRKLKNLGMRKSLSLYIFLGTIAALAVIIVIVAFIEKWKNIILIVKGADIENHIYFWGWDFNSHGYLPETLYKKIMWLNYLEIMLALLIVIVAILCTSHLYYKKKIEVPFQLLMKEMQNISREDLNFDCSYLTDDEMGQICIGFNQMRVQLINNRKNLWGLMNNQRELNAAFAHDIRTPLTVIKGYTQMLLKYYKQGLISEEKLLETLKMIDQQADRMERFSNTMREIHSFEEFDPSKKTLVIHELFASVKNNAKGMVSKNPELSLTVTISEMQNEKKTIVCDCILIQEIVDNLLANAMRYAKQRIVLEMNLKKDKLYIYVRDDGEGFSAVAMENAMRPYFSTSEEHFGLGLSISRILTQKHGGNLELMNSIDGGAIVCAYFYVA